MRLTGVDVPGRGAVRALADRHGVRPTKSLGQNFLVDPNLARAIAAEVGAAPGMQVLEVGAGMGSLTVALAAAGARVHAIEFDRALVPALHEAVAAAGVGDRVTVERADAMRREWSSLLGDGSGWAMASNLPYNVAVPLLLDLLGAAPRLRTLVVMVQREVADRLVASPGAEAYGAVSVKVAYHGDARLVRRVPSSVFWPEPKVESAIVRIDPHAPRVACDRADLFRVVDASFAQRRKTMTNALRRLGLARDAASAVLADAGIRPDARPEQLDLGAFARITASLAGAGSA